jgi:hypothetical protein
MPDLFTSTIDFSAARFRVGGMGPAYFIGVEIEGVTRPVTDFLASELPFKLRHYKAREVAEFRVRVLEGLQRDGHADPFLAASSGCVGHCSWCDEAGHRARVDLFDGLVPLDATSTPLPWLAHPETHEYVCRDCARGL